MSFAWEERMVVGNSITLRNPELEALLNKVILTLIIVENS